MSLRFALDSNVLSEPPKANPDRRVLRFLEDHQARIAVPVPVWHELYFGWLCMAPSRRREMVEDYLFRVVRETLPMLAYDEAAASWHAEERSRLRRLGLPIAVLDGQIAAIAKVNGLVLVTANARHFEPFAGLEVESWATPTR